jgi:anti-anti-sigma factor
MGISVREGGGVYHLSGELDWEGGEDLRIGMRPARTGSRELVLDLSYVRFINSMGVWALALLAKKRWGVLVLHYPQEALMRVFELLQLDEMAGIRIELE